MHFFVVELLSIAVMTYAYVYHVRNLRPTRSCNVSQGL